MSQYTTMNKQNNLIRCIVALVLFIIVPIIGYYFYNVVGYDGQNDVLFYLSGVIAAGCYWIGSRPSN